MVLREETNHLFHLFIHVDTKIQREEREKGQLHIYIDNIYRNITSFHITHLRKQSAFFIYFLVHTLKGGCKKIIKIILFAPPVKLALKLIKAV